MVIGTINKIGDDFVINSKETEMKTNESPDAGVTLCEIDRNKNDTQSTRDRNDENLIDIRPEEIKYH